MNPLVLLIGAFVLLIFGVFSEEGKEAFFAMGLGLWVIQLSVIVDNNIKKH